MGGLCEASFWRGRTSIRLSRSLYLVRALGTAKNRPTYVRALPPKSIGGGGCGPYFRSIPDFGEQEGGVLLSGVRAGSPTDKAGAKKGDLLVCFNKIQVKSLEDFTIALRGTRPGDFVEGEVQRQGQVHKMKVTPERRQ